MPAAAQHETPRVSDLQSRAVRQQQRLLYFAAGLIAPYYLGFYALGTYPLRALAVGLCIPLLLAVAGWRLARGGEAEAGGWLVAATSGMSFLAVLTAHLANGTACIGFHVVWALPLVYGILAPSAVAACLAGAAISVAGGLALMIRDGHPPGELLQWSVLACGAAVFSVSRTVLHRREQRTALDQARQAGERLASSEGRYRLLAEHTQDVIWTLDLATLRFTYVSPSVLAQRGYTAEEVLQQSLADALVPESLARAAAVIGRLGTPEEEDPHVGIYQQPCRDGTIKHVEISATAARDAEGRPVEITGTSRDVTARVLAEQALRRSEERFRVLIEKSTDMLVVFDRDQRVQTWSASAVDLLGWRPEEVLGHTLRELGIVHPEDAPAAAAVAARLESGHDAVERIRTRCRHRDGSWRLLEGLARSLVDDPAVQGVVLNLRDVTERQRLEAQLHRAQKLESIGRLAGGVAHDFNNVLTVILSCAEGLRGDAAAGRPADAEALEELRLAGQRARDLTRQLLAFARRQPVSPTKLDLNEVATRSEKLLRRAVGEQVALRFELAPGLWPTVCDAGQLDQVLLNLAVNARDAMPDGGTVVVSTANATVGADAAARQAGQRPGDWVRLEVRDDGAGMSSEVQAHLFEPFFTTKPAGEGTGLGLATVYGIVQQSGGHVHVESEPGRGTAIRICLPRAPGAARPTPVEGLPAVVPGGSELVLVVEDDPMVRAVAVRVLRRAGYRVLEADGGEAALRHMAEAPEPPGLVVTDVVMPGMGGREVAEALRRRHGRLRVLYVSGYAREAIGPKELEVPHTAFLAKPFSAPALLAQVRTLLDAP